MTDLLLRRVFTLRQGSWVIEDNRRVCTDPKDDGTSVVEFMTAEGDVLSISIPRNETGVIRHFQERMPHALRAG